MKKIKKKKAFIGAAIGLASSVIGAIGDGIRAKKQAKLDQEKYEREQAQLNQQTEQQNANVLQNELWNQAILDEQLNRKVSIDRMGGCHKKKKIKKKAGLGAEWKNMSSTAKFNDIAGGATSAVGAIGNLVGALTSNPKDYTLKQPEVLQAQAPKVIKDPNAPIQQPIAQQPQMINQNPILAQAKLGCKRIKKRNTNRFK